MPPTTTPPPPTTTPRPKIEIHKTHGHYLKARLSGGRDLNEGTYHGENLICYLETMDLNQFLKSIYQAKFFQASIFRLLSCFLARAHSEQLVRQVTVTMKERKKDLLE